MKGRAPLAHTSTMAHAVQTLAIVLEQENAALQAMDFSRAGSLLAAKHQAADALAEAWRAAEPDDIDAGGLRALGQVAEENRQLLKRAMRVQRRVLDLVAKAARIAPQGARYGAAGKPATAYVGAQTFRARC